MNSKQKGSSQLCLPLPDPKKLRDSAIYIVSSQNDHATLLNFPGKRIPTFRERIRQDLIRNHVIID
jgi:hypothetical protein